MKFDSLENDAIVVYSEDNPKLKIRRKLKHLPRELTLSPSELVEVLEKEAKIRKLQAIKIQHCQKITKTPTSILSPSGSDVRNKVAALYHKESLKPNKQALYEWEHAPADALLLL